MIAPSPKTTKAASQQPLKKQYPGRELNPYSPCGPQDFKSCVSTSSTTRVFIAYPYTGRELNPTLHYHEQKRCDCITPFSGAEDEARTRDLNLGKVALYQLSYFRVCIILKNNHFYRLLKSGLQK